MLKKNNVGGTKGVKRTGEVKIFKIVKVVPKQGLVVEFQDGEQAMLTASSYFVTMKNKSKNFIVKSEGNKMHDRFYEAMLKPTTNPLHEIRLKKDTVSAKLIDTGSKKDVDGQSIRHLEIDAGFNVFARDDIEVKDQFDENVTRIKPGDSILGGYARFVFDPKAPNRNGGKGLNWVEVVSESTNPASMDELFDLMRKTASATYGNSLFVRILNEQGQNEAQGSYYPSRAMAEVEEDIQQIKDLNLDPSRINMWTISPRMYIANEFFEVPQSGGKSKFERFELDALHIYKVKCEETPVRTEMEEEPRPGRKNRLPKSCFHIPVLVSRSNYVGNTGDIMQGSVHNIVPVGGNVIPTNHLYLSPVQRSMALAAATPSDDFTPDVPAAEADTPAASAAPSAGGDGWGWDDDAPAAN